MDIHRHCRRTLIPTLAAFAALAAACSSQPKRVQPPSPQGAPIPPGHPEGEVSRELVSQGYQPSTYHGQLIYCRVEKLTGSQFSHKVCLSEQEAKLQERIAHDEMNTAHGLGKCLPPQCND